MRSAYLHRPAVVSTAKCIGEQRIDYGILPQEANRGINDLCGQPLAVTELDAFIHILPVATERHLAIKIAQIAAGLLLAVADDCA